MDSDFDIDEKDELKSDDDGDAPKRKKRGVDTKAYKVGSIIFTINTHCFLISIPNLSLYNLLI